MSEKKRLWLSVGLACVWQASAFAGPTDGLEVIGQVHHVWGYAGSTDLGGTRADYDQTSLNPMYVSVTGTYVEDYEYPAEAASWTGYFALWADAGPWYAFANAQIEYTFRPEVGVEALAFQVEGDGYGWELPDESNLRFRLDDLTSGTTMALVTAPPENLYWGDFDGLWDVEWNGRFAVDPTHTYVATLYTGAGQGDSGRVASMEVSVSPATPPVPGAVPVPGALLLGVLGVGLARRLRRGGIL